MSNALRRALEQIVNFCDDPNGSEKPESLAMGLARLLPGAREALATQDQGQSGWQAINMNEKVRVKLTDRGRTVHLENHVELMTSLPKDATLKYCHPKEDKDGWSEWQLWSLMQEFGAHMLMRWEPPFETTVEVRSPPALAVSEEEVTKGTYLDVDGKRQVVMKVLPDTEDT